MDLALVEKYKPIHAYQAIKRKFANSAEMYQHPQEKKHLTSSALFEADTK